MRTGDLVHDGRGEEQMALRLFAPDQGRDEAAEKGVVLQPSGESFGDQDDDSTRLPFSAHVWRWSDALSAGAKAAVRHPEGIDSPLRAKEEENDRYGAQLWRRLSFGRSHAASPPSPRMATNSGRGNPIGAGDDPGAGQGRDVPPLPPSLKADILETANGAGDSSSSRNRGATGAHEAGQDAGVVALGGHVETPAEARVGGPGGNRT
ncbi:hypothetical protein P8C59_000288 [Phyllachora maydis]|uniref:Uncharacterized protein n=1 Tax=Phyllachora maydis TaxID=1825666 RepID=A0AAD9HVL8_9PEZI|nr:hypothetical protein P8C59_000288 [Phyllachora maydis]